MADEAFCMKLNRNCLQKTKKWGIVKDENDLILEY